ncbi:SpoIIE family protein phosphatase [Streptomyces sp. MMS24-I2-30]|uniref:SpoIIE family protein phosphatase n=1 Tax=Streptomyces sp. MMS24-I2-30 TaxID=3351564 RepID=UPI003896B867
MGGDPPPRRGDDSPPRTGPAAAGPRDPPRDPLGRAASNAHRLGAVAAAVYLLTADGSELRPAVIGGSPPAVLTLPGRMALDTLYSSAHALVTREPAFLADPDPQREPEPGTVAYPYTVAAVPLMQGEHRFGSLTVLRTADSGGYSDLDCRRLRRIGDRHAAALAGLLDQGAVLTPGNLPLLVPVFGTLAPSPPHGIPEITWGVPGVAGSVGMSLMYPLHRLAAMLNRATTMEHVTAAAEFCLRAPFRAQAMALASAADGRLWVVGHSGRSSRLVHEVHGTPLHARTPAARAAQSRAGRALFFPASPDGESGPGTGRGTPKDRGHAAVVPDGGSGPGRGTAKDRERAAMAPDSESGVAGDRGHALACLPLIGSRHVVDLPIARDDHTVGVCCLAFGGPRSFAPEEMAVLSMMAGLLGSAVERVVLGARCQAFAENVQARLLPSALTEVPRLSTAARYQPATVCGETGGDWYDVIRMPDDRVALVIGDVEGHTIESAAVMGQLRSAVAAYAAEGHGPAALLQRTGALLARLGTDLLATCCVVALDTDDGTAEVALAGHPMPLLRLPDGTVRPLRAPANVPLGLTNGTPYHAWKHTLPTGALLMLYSDGLLDPVDPGGTGASELLATLGREAGDNLEDLADRLLQGMTGSCGRRDDTALLLARYKGADDRAMPRTGRLHIHRRDLRAVAQARGFVHERLREWGLADLSDDLQLMTSEVVTNALVHAGSDVDIRIRFFGDRVRLEVRDEATDPPVPALYSLSEEGSSRAEHGRGLYLVDALARAWNTSPNGRGKTVWLEVDVRDAADRRMT